MKYRNNNHDQHKDDKIQANSSFTHKHKKICENKETLDDINV